MPLLDAAATSVSVARSRFIHRTVARTASFKGGLDAPTNITLADDGSLYVSTGRGTPARPIPGPDRPTAIVGQVLRITGF